MSGPWYSWWWLWALIAAACAGVGYLKVRVFKCIMEKRNKSRRLPEDEDVDAT